MDMATKQQILEKIATLLQDINDQFGQLTDHPNVADDLKGDLFEATVSYFAAHVSIYNKLLKSDNSTAEESEDQTIFTPSLDAVQENAVHTEQMEEVRGSEETADSTDETTEIEVEEGVWDEADAEESPVSIEVGTDENHEEEEEVSEEASSEDVVNEGEEEKEEPLDDETPGEPVDETLPVDTENSGDDNRTEEAEVKEVVNEVTIENKEVQVEPEPERPTRPLSLNERISAQRKGETTTAHSLLSVQRGGAERVTDIKSAISLNDKLLFIKDLFNGYSLAYSEAVELLNRYDDFASADAFLQANYAKKNNWADKPAAVDKLYAVLRKRFG